MNLLKKFGMFLLVLCCASVFALHASSFPTWLVGDWQGKVGDGMYYENWTQNGNFEMVGNAYLMKGDQKVSQEILRLEKISNHLVYIAVVDDNTPVMFTLKPQTVDNEWVFENTEHDYPQRISYTQKTPTSLLARVEGLIEGKLVTEEFHLEKK